MSGDAALPDDVGCRILHVDMDAFYASVELRDQPGLRGRPVVVGGLGNRGVVLSATYEARAFGVRSAMPVSRARRLCPQAVFLPPGTGCTARFPGRSWPSSGPLPRGWSRSRSTRRSSTCPAPGGGSARLRAIAELIRRQVREQQSITCSVGVAPVKFVAKIASARCKPDGLLVVPAHGLLEFLHPLPVSALWGVGDRAEEVLARLGLRTVGDIAHVPEATLRRELGVAGRAPARPRLGPGRAAGHPAAGGEERRRRGDVPRGRRRPGSHQEGAAAAVRPDRAGAARRRVRRADGDREAPARQLQDHHPVADASPSRPTWPGRSTRPRARCTRARGSMAGHGCGSSASAPPGCARPPGPRGSWRSVTARRAGGKRSRRWTGSPADSGPTRCGRPHFSELHKSPIGCFRGRAGGRPFQRA